MYNIKTLRGTIFCSPIKYTKDFVSSLAGLVDDYMPIIVRDNGALPILPIWQLTSPDEKESLFFNGDKIDLVKTIEGEIDDDVIRQFTERCKIVFGKIIEVTKFVCTRMAFAPSVIITENGERASGLYDRLFSVRNFNEVPLDTSNLSQVYRLILKIGNKEIKINHVANFRTENELISINGNNQLRERFMGDFDINTMFDPNYKFSENDIQDFFDISLSCFKNFYKLYFD